MRIHLISILSLAILVPLKSMALEPVNEAHAMFYYQVPFSATKTEEKKPSFGFRMDHTSYEHGGMIQYQKLMNKTAAFDFKMGHEGVQGMYVSGVDYLQRYRLHRAAEDEEGSMDEEAGMDAETEMDTEAEDEMATSPAKKKSPGVASKIGTDVANTFEDIINVIPLGFLIGGAVAIVLVTGAGG